MVLLQKMDTVMYEAQRQGRISFYMQSIFKNFILYFQLLAVHYNF